MILTEAKARGLKVHAWINTSLLANLDALPADSACTIYIWLSAVPRSVAAELYAMRHRRIRATGKIVEWSEAVPVPNWKEFILADFKVRDHIYKIWLDILRDYEIDGLHFDYIRLASPDFDFSCTSLKTFEKWLATKLSPTDGGN